MSSLKKYFHGNGKVESEGMLDEYGRKTGEWRWYDENGQLRRQVPFSSLAGPDPERHFWETGEKALEGNWRYGRRTGEWSWYHRNGQRHKQYSYDQNGFLQGDYTEWYEHGQIQVLGRYQDNKRTGTWREYHPNGKEKTCRSYTSPSTPNAASTYTSWYDTGVLKSRGQTRAWESFGDGMEQSVRDRIGEWEWYDSDGRLKERRFFSDTGSPKTTTYHASGAVWSEATPKTAQELGLSYPTSYWAFTEWYETGGVFRKGAIYYELWDPEGWYEFPHNPAGEWLSYHRNGQMASRVTHVCGKANGNGKDGPYTSWYENGAIHEKGEYQGDKKSGEWYCYRADGSLDRQYTYKYGQCTADRAYHPNGRQRNEVNFDQYGKKQGTETFYHESGQVESKCSYVDGRIVGDYIRYYPDGQKQEIKTYNQYGQLHGRQVKWYATGRIQEEGEHDQGWISGRWRRYDPSGLLTEELVYPSKDQQEAMGGRFVKEQRLHEPGSPGRYTYTSWFKPGVVEAKGVEQDGKPVGEWLWYYDYGRLRQKATYHDDGQMAERRIYDPFDPARPTQENACTRWSRSGDVEVEGREREGTPIGQWTWYRSNREIHQQVTYRDDGQKAEQRLYDAGSQTRFTLTRWSATGAIELQGAKSNDTPVGEWTWYGANDHVQQRATYHDDGQMAEQRLFDAGSSTRCACTRWSSAGALLAKGVEESGRQVGEWVWYHPDGQVHQRATYHANGRMAEQRTYQTGQPTRCSLIRWTEAGVIELRGAKNDDTPVGEWTWYGANDQVQRRATYHDNGQMAEQRLWGAGSSTRCTYTRWSSTGVVEVEGAEIAGTPAETWTWYRANKQVSKRASYHASGKVAEQQLYDADSSTRCTYTRWFDTGKLQGTGVMDDGRRVGEWTWYAADGRVTRTIHHSSGKEAEKRLYDLGSSTRCAYTRWSDTGKLEETGVEDAGQRVGEWTSYAADGRVTRTTYHSSGKKAEQRVHDSASSTRCRYARWSDTGVLEVEGEENAGTPVGTWTWYRANKQVSKRAIYHANGKTANQRVYDADSTTRCTYTQWSDTGKLEGTGVEDGGQRTGEWTWYAASGQVTRVTYHGSGKEAEKRVHDVGSSTRCAYTKWSATGTLLIQGTEEAGTPAGSWTWYRADQQVQEQSTYHASGKKAEQRLFDAQQPTRCTYTKSSESGAVEVQGAEDGGKRVGEWKWFGANGQVRQRATYHDNGEKAEQRVFDAERPTRCDYTRWSATGILLVKGVEDAGAPIGEWTWYHQATGQNGRRAEQRVFDAERPTRCAYTRWSATGILLAQGVEDAGTPIGEWTGYDLDGRVCQRAMHLGDGQMVEQHVHDSTYSTWTCTRWSETGALQKKWEEVGGRRAREWTYLADGSSEERRFGDPERPERCFYLRFSASGALEVSGAEANGKRVGEWWSRPGGGAQQREWYRDNGQKAEQRTYDPEQPDRCTYTRWFETGIVAEEGVEIEETVQVVYEVHHRRRRIGEWRWYHPSGRLQHLATYHRNGQMEARRSYPDWQSTRYTYARWSLHGTLEERGEEQNGRRVGEWQSYYGSAWPRSQTSYHGNGQMALSRFYLSDDPSRCTLSRYSEAGALLAEGVEENGVLRRQTWFHPNGKVREEANYGENGRLDGEHTWRYDTGSLRAQGVESGGLRKGIWSWYYPNGKLEERRSPDDFGRIRIGVDTLIHQPLAEESDGLGMFEGRYTVWYASENVYLSGEYAGGRRSGDWTWFYPDGQLRRQMAFYDGKENGLHREWLSDGTLIVEGGWVLGQKHGEWKAWYPDGRPSESITYRHGIRDGATAPAPRSLVSLTLVNGRNGPMAYLYHPTGQTLSILVENTTDGDVSLVSEAPMGAGPDNYHFQLHFPPDTLHVGYKEALRERRADAVAALDALGWDVYVHDGGAAGDRISLLWRGGLVTPGEGDPTHLIDGRLRPGVGALLPLSGFRVHAGIGSRVLSVELRHDKLQLIDGSPVPPGQHTESLHLSSSSPTRREIAEQTGHWRRVDEVMRRQRSMARSATLPLRIYWEGGSLYIENVHRERGEPAPLHLVQPGTEREDTRPRLFLRLNGKLSHLTHNAGWSIGDASPHALRCYRGHWLAGETIRIILAPSDPSDVTLWYENVYEYGWGFIRLSPSSTSSDISPAFRRLGNVDLLRPRSRFRGGIRVEGPVEDDEPCLEAGAASLHGGVCIQDVNEGHSGLAIVVEGKAPDDAHRGPYPALSVQQPGSAPAAVFSGGKVCIDVEGAHTALDLGDHALTVTARETAATFQGRVSFGGGLSVQTSATSDSASFTGNGKVRIARRTSSKLAALSVEGAWRDGDLQPLLIVSYQGRYDYSLSSSLATFRGNIRAREYQQLSDLQLKQNIRPLSGALEKALALRGVSFRWRADTHDRTRFGFIAQEVEAVLPQLVSSDESGSKAISTTGLTPVLLEALRELHGELAATGHHLGELQRRLDGLEERRPRALVAGVEEPTP